MMSIPNSWCRACLCILFLSFVCLPLFAQNNASGYDPFTHPAVLHTGFLNTDCVPDTIYGLLDKNLRWTPRYICWGQLYDADGAVRCKAGAYETTIARSKQVDTTHFVFPDWARFSCAISIENFNKNDTLFDAIFWLSGVVSLPGRGRVDTGMAVVVFGQSGLETHATLDLGAVGTFRKAPFYAMQLGKDRELTNPKKA